VRAGGILDDALADRIAQSKLVQVDHAGRKNDHHYVLTPRTTVGLLRVSHDLILHIRPEVSVQNVFGMLELVHDLPSLRFYSGIGYVEKIADIHARLAAMFARRVLQRLSLGLYAAYVDREEDSRVVRGRVELARTAILQSRGETAVGCAYQLQTFDIDDNRILLWTLDRILRLGLQQDGERGGVCQGGVCSCSSGVCAGVTSGRTRWRIRQRGCLLLAKESTSR
jgi:hypothetical protein